MKMSEIWLGSEAQKPKASVPSDAPLACELCGSSSAQEPLESTSQALQDYKKLLQQFLLTLGNGYPVTLAPLLWGGAVGFLFGKEVKFLQTPKVVF